MRRLLEGKRLLKGSAYFDVNTQKCGVYQRAALIRGNTVYRNFSEPQDSYENSGFEP